MRIKEIIDFLRCVTSRPCIPSSDVAAVLAEQKSSMLYRNDEAGAKLVWRLQQALRAQDLYLRAFVAMKEGPFYDAWCDLEQAELALCCLEPHEAEFWFDFRLDFIRDYIEKWQGLFPYKLFLSPEILELEKVCSICRTKVSLRNPCGHRVGEIYRGEMCCRIVTDAKFLGVAIVKNPVQKYSVVFLSDPETGEQRDHYNYALVEYAIAAVRQPFHTWSTTSSQRLQPHERFRHVGRNDPCPCDSKFKYKECCLQRKGVLRPHVQFSFEVAPLNDLPAEVYVQ